MAARQTSTKTPEGARPATLTEPPRPRVATLYHSSRSPPSRAPARRSRAQRGAPSQPAAAAASSSSAAAASRWRLEEGRAAVESFRRQKSTQRERGHVEAGCGALGAERALGTHLVGRGRRRVVEAGVAYAAAVARAVVDVGRGDGQAVLQRRRRRRVGRSAAVGAGAAASAALLTFASSQQPALRGAEGARADGCRLHGRGEAPADGGRRSPCDVSQRA